MPIPLVLRIAPVALAAVLVIPWLGRQAPEPSAVPASRSPATPFVRDFAALDSIVEDGVRRQVYPGAVVVVGRRDSILHARGYGRLTWSASSPVPSPDSTLWDIASMTKVVGTASAALRLVDRGELELDAPVRRYVTAFSGGGRDAVTVRMLLDHTSGLRSYAQLFRLTRSREDALAMVLREPVRRPPGDSAVYSDLNAILLGLVLERVGGRPLDELVIQEVVTPLGLTQTLYRPPRSMHARAAPTGVFRGTPMRGQVNDPNAAHLGGVAGHAGLFSTGSDIARFAQAWLSEGRTPAGQWVAPETVQRFLAPSPGSGTRLLGWDTRDSTLAAKGELSVFGELVSGQAYGHTGWTGTEMWIDPVNDIFLVFLTNRAFDPRSAESIVQLREVRARLSDATVRLVPPPEDCLMLASAPRSAGEC
jgi:CubicO group peptidase (beta-lactamase class C family)